MSLFYTTDGPEDRSSKLLSTPFIEEPGHRLKWTAHLEFTHNHEVGDLTWDKVRTQELFDASESNPFEKWGLTSMDTTEVHI